MTVQLRSCVFIDSYIGAALFGNFHTASWSCNMSYLVVLVRLWQQYKLSGNADLPSLLLICSCFVYLCAALLICYKFLSPVNTDRSKIITGRSKVCCTCIHQHEYRHPSQTSSYYSTCINFTCGHAFSCKSCPGRSL